MPSYFLLTKIELDLRASCGNRWEDFLEVFGSEPFLLDKHFDKGIQILTIFLQ